jgi:hypothetical protein
MRLAAELKELGFDALLIEPEGEATSRSSRSSLDASAREVGAVAAIRAVPSGESVEVWIADRGTGKTLEREMADESADPDSALVLRTVELLRASLLDIALPEEPAGEAPSPPDIARALEIRPPSALAAERPLPSSPPPPLRVLRFALAPGVLVSPGGFSPMPAFGVGIDWRLTDTTGLVGLGMISLADARAEQPEGTVDLSVWSAGAAVRLFLTEPQSPWAPSIDVGAMLLHLTSGARAEKGFIGLSSSASAAAPFVRVGLARSLPLPVRLRADVLVSALMQGVSVRVADREAATWGEPMVLISFGVDAGLF